MKIGIFASEIVIGFFFVMLFSAKNFQNFLCTIYKISVEMPGVSGRFPKEPCKLQWIAQGIDFIFSFPDPWRTCRFIVTPASTVSSFIECVGIWIDVDALELSANYSSD